MVRQPVPRFHATRRVHRRDVAVHERADARAYRLDLVHGVGGHERASASRGVPLNPRPDGAPRVRVHRARRRVQEKKHRISEEGDRDGELPPPRRAELARGRVQNRGGGGVSRARVFLPPPEGSREPVPTAAADAVVREAVVPKRFAVGRYPVAAAARAVLLRPSPSLHERQPDSLRGGVRDRARAIQPVNRRVQRQMFEDAQSLPQRVVLQAHADSAAL
mmetsp:Transcript_3787/g.13066  ORF Transcript_3787/g.13066 Transcript_3787/m.13066 type:complete len:220 (-) Transcript_3787:852-1511(-)